MRRGGTPNYVIRLSRDPAIPTFYACDAQGTYYASSEEGRAFHYRLRGDAERINSARTLHGVIQRCGCRTVR